MNKPANYYIITPYFKKIIEKFTNAITVVYITWPRIRIDRGKYAYSHNCSWPTPFLLWSSWNSPKCIQGRQAIAQWSEIIEYICRKFILLLLWDKCYYQLILEEIYERASAQMERTNKNLLYTPSPTLHCWMLVQLCWCIN